MAGVALGGTFNSLGKNGDSDDSNNRYIHFAPINKNLMVAVYDFYMRGNAMISRASSIKSEQALGRTFYFEWAGKEEIKPSDGFDYTGIMRAKIEKAVQMIEMFGFVAFLVPNDSARAEIMRQEQQRTQTPEEIATERIKQCTAKIMSILKSQPGGGEAASSSLEETANSRRRVGGSSRTATAAADGGDPKEEARAAERRRVNFALDPRSEIRTGRMVGGGQMSFRETSMYNGTAITASDSRIDFVRKNFEQVERREKEERQRTLNVAAMLVRMASVEIVDVDAGQFYVEVDDMKHTRRLRWVPNSRVRQNAQGSAMELQHIDDDPHVHVCEWPGREVTREGIIQTDFVELMRLRDMLRECEDNAMDANFQSAHPTPFIEQSRAPDKIDLMELPEENIYGMDNVRATFDPNSMSAQEMQTHKTNAYDAAMLDIVVNLAHDDQLQKRAMKMASGRARATRATRGGLNVADMRTTAFEKSGIMHLPNGLKLGGTLNPKLVVDMKEMRAVYEKHICIAVGVPHSYLTGEQAGSNSKNRSAKASTEGSTSHSATTTEQMMRSTILNYREKASHFVENMYHALFHDSDNEQLTQRLADTKIARQKANESRDALLFELQKSYNVVKDIAALDDNLASVLSEAARLCAAEHELRSVVQMPYRLKLKFAKAPFVETSDIFMMLKLGALSHHEAVNILRAQKGLENIDDEEITRIRQDNLQFIAQQTMAEAPPPQQGSVTTVEKVRQGQTKQKGENEAAAPAATGSGNKAAAGAGNKASESKGDKQQQQQQQQTTGQKSDTTSKETETITTTVAYEDRGDRQEQAVGGKRKAKQGSGEKRSRARAPPLATSKK